jgi:hypothetical protein
MASAGRTTKERGNVVDLEGSGVLSRNFLGGAEEHYEESPNEIRTDHLPNTNQEGYICIKPLGRDLGVNSVITPRIFVRVGRRFGGTYECFFRASRGREIPQSTWGP